MTIIYALFARDSAEMDRARGEQLNMQRPSAESLYPAYMWDTMSVQAREAWIEDEAKRYDRFNRLVSLTVLSVPLSVLRGDITKLDSCVIHRDDNEKALLTYIWNGFEEAYRNQFQICGWKIREDIWPRLVNRSLALDVPVPVWAKPDLSKKWFDVQLHDLATAYSCGVWGRVRPLPPIQYAMKFWLGRDFPREDEVRLKAEMNPSDEAIREATCDYVFGMAEVLHRYVK